jgi:6,7-dimethyl-8-ribityllumazine synthase
VIGFRFTRHSPMSTAQPLRPRIVGKTKLNLSLVASQYNLPYVQGLVAAVEEEMSTISAGARMNIVWVPGAFEIPLLTKLILSQEKPDVVIALGVLIQGETAHALLVAQSVTTALQNLAVEFSTPIINEVLLLENEEQARVRCLGDEINRGTEAARAAVAVAHAVRETLKPR